GHVSGFGRARLGRRFGVAETVPIDVTVIKPRNHVFVDLAVAVIVQTVTYLHGVGIAHRIAVGAVAKHRDVSVVVATGRDPRVFAAIAVAVGIVIHLYGG